MSLHKLASSEAVHYIQKFIREPYNPSQVS